MAEQKRGDLGFGAALDEFDPNDWGRGATPLPDRRPHPKETQETAEQAGFVSRQGAQGAKKLRRRRTGRTAQLNLKTKPEAVEEFCAIADALDWGLAETFERAIPLLRKEFLSE